MTMGWASNSKLSLNLLSTSTNDSIQHVYRLTLKIVMSRFSYGETNRQWEPRVQLLPEQKSENLSLNVDRLLTPRKETEADLSYLDSLIEGGLLTQPISISEIREQLKLRFGVSISETRIEMWLRQRGMQEFVSSALGEACCRFDGTVWIDPARFETFTSPHNSLEHPLDQKRIEKLEKLWGKA